MLEDYVHNDLDKEFREMVHTLTKKDIVINGVLGNYSVKDNKGDTYTLATKKVGDRYISCNILEFVKDTLFTKDMVYIDETGAHISSSDDYKRKVLGSSTISHQYMGENPEVLLEVLNYVTRYSFSLSDDVFETIYYTQYKKLIPNITEKLNTYSKDNPDFILQILQSKSLKSFLLNKHNISLSFN
jgi:hypothetical protein